MKKNKTKIIFYKGLRSNIIDKCISIWTLSKYSHLEIIGKDGYCYSSSSKDKGVRKKQIDYLNTDKWDIYEIEIDLNTIESLFNQTKDSKYDWLGIFFYHLFPFKLEDKKKWYCSEWISELLVRNNYITPINLTPGGVYRFLKKTNKIKKINE